MKPFQYQILRYIRNISSGEFINVAIILYNNEAKELLTKCITSTERLSNFFPGIDIECIIQIIHDICNWLEEINPGVDELTKITKEVSSKGSSSFIFSESRHGITDDFNKSLNMLFNELVSKNDID